MKFFIALLLLAVAIVGNALNPPGAAKKPAGGGAAPAGGAPGGGGGGAGGSGAGGSGAGGGDLELSWLPPQFVHGMGPYGRGIGPFPIFHPNSVNGFQQGLYPPSPYGNGYGNFWGFHGPYGPGAYNPFSNIGQYNYPGYNYPGPGIARGFYQAYSHPAFAAGYPVHPAAYHPAAFAPAHPMMRPFAPPVGPYNSAWAMGGGFPMFSKKKEAQSPRFRAARKKPTTNDFLSPSFDTDPSSQKDRLKQDWRLGDMPAL